MRSDDPRIEALNEMRQQAVIDKIKNSKNLQDLKENEAAAKTELLGGTGFSASKVIKLTQLIEEAVEITRVSLKR
jgi:hypothetical protein